MSSMRYQPQQEVPTYTRQQSILNEIARDLGVIAYRPSYHSKDNDCNTVLFYTLEDYLYNQMLEKQGITDTVEYHRPFFTFENTDPNRQPSYAFANCGQIDLRSGDFHKILKSSVKSALNKRLNADRRLV